MAEVSSYVGWLITLIFGALLAGCGGGGGGSSDAPPAPVLGGKTVSMTIHSSQTGINYDLSVYIPASYDRTSSTFPIVYAMDAEYRFAPLVAAIQQKGADVILVNVGAMGDARRWIDFTMPGATNYYRFLTLELIPLVESQYRSDQRRRILSGHSLSGEFVMYAMYMEDPANRFFASVVSGDCSCWYDSMKDYSLQLDIAVAMEQQMFDRSRQLPVNLFMASSNGGSFTITTVYQHLVQRGFEQLHPKMVGYQLAHVPMDGPSFYDALSFILDAPKLATR